MCNQHLKRYLDYYCNLESDPQFAVLINGKWGTGKTWFIENYLDQNKQFKALYVSLYGIDSLEQIANEFYAQLHPFLGSPKVKLLKRIVAKSIKLSLKVDLEGGGTASVSVPDLELAGTPKNLILVFDDLERTTIPFDRVLGYINSFVEHEECKVIILANEEEVLANSPDGNTKAKYLRIKEKLIGKTFEVVADVENSLKAFIEEISNSKLKEFLTENRAQIIKIFNAAQHRNLRVLRQSVKEFELLYELLPQKAIEHKELLSKLLAIELVLSFGLRTGELLLENIIKLSTSFLVSGLSSDVDGGTKSFLNKFSSIFLDDSFILTSDLWSDFFKWGYADKQRISECIDKSTFFCTNESPNWVRLWHYSRDLTDTEFKDLLAAVRAEFDQRHYLNVGIIKHIFGLFLLFSKEGALPESPDVILTDAKAYINDVVADLECENQRGIWDGYGGLMYYSIDADEFREFDKHIQERREWYRLSMLPGEATYLIATFERDPVSFINELLPGNPGARYIDLPILKYFDIPSFVRRLTEHQPTLRNHIYTLFSERYKRADITPLLSESDWLEDVAEEAEKLSKSANFLGTPNGIFLKRFAFLIRNSILSSPAFNE